MKSVFINHKIVFTHRSCNCHDFGPRFRWPIRILYLYHLDPRNQCDIYLLQLLAL